MNANYILGEIRWIKKNIGLWRTDTVCAEIYGKKCDLTETDVRCLQVMAKKAAEIGDEAFDEFTKNVIVYSGGKKTKSHKMEFRKDGCFSNEFEKGFYDVNVNLSYNLF